MIDGLNDEHREALIDVLSANTNVERIVLFGSRATETYSVTSDIDVALFGDELSQNDVGLLRAMVDDLPYPHKVDLLAYKSIRNDKLRNEIDDHGVVWFKRLAPLNYDRRETTLGECIAINDSTYSPRENWQLVNYLDTGNITENRIDTIQEIDVANQKLPTRARRKVKPGDVVYSTVRPNQRHYGIINDPPPNFLASTGFAVLRGIEEIADTEFIYWYLTQNHIVEYLHAVAENSTSAYPSIKPSDLELLTLKLPPLPEQRRIAGILGALDEKIELNRRMNETLEGMARAVFKDWFVDFGPVRAKMEGREAYLPEEIWRLFPDRLMESELGLVPEGWGVKALDEIANYRNGLALQKFRPESDQERLPVVKIAQLRSGVADSGEWATASITPECVIEDGDVVFSWSGSLLVKVWTGGRAALNQHLFKVTSTEYPKWLYLHFTKHHLAEFQSIAADKTTTMGHIKRQHLREAKCAVPASDLLNAASDRLESLLQQSISNDVASRRIVNLRNQLLPGLVSGEMHVIESTRMKTRP